MTKTQKIALFLMFTSILALYAFWMKNNNKKPIEIKPIKIEALSSKEEIATPKVEKTEPLDILSKLKVATTASKEGIIPSKEEVSNKVLESLKNKIAKQEIEKIVVKKPVIQKPIIPKVVVKKIVKKVIKEKVIAKKVKVAKTAKIVKKTKVVKKIKIKVREKAQISQKSKITTPKQKVVSTLSRKEEVALYNNKYASTLEVVNVSENFEIKEEKMLPDSHYFEPLKAVKTVDSNAPLKFVEKLGVVTVSGKYESNFAVPTKVEVAKEGIVNFSGTSIETAEMKKLEFVDTLGVVEVSKDFETIEANKYLE